MQALNDFPAFFYFIVMSETERCLNSIAAILSRKLDVKIVRAESFRPDDDHQKDFIFSWYENNDPLIRNFGISGSSFEECRENAFDLTEYYIKLGRPTRTIMSWEFKANREPRNNEDEVSRLIFGLLTFAERTGNGN